MIVYADNAATTPIDDAVRAYMDECAELYGNPHCDHAKGKEAREIVENARNTIAQKINAEPEEIIFTSGGTEANNLAIRQANGHVITTAAEHVSLLKPVKYSGQDYTILPVDSTGRVDIEQLQEEIYDDTTLISVIYANNEMGTIQNIAEISKMAKMYGVCFHTDAVAAFGHFNIDVKALGIDMMTLSAHKIYAPKGVGVLYANKNIDIEPLIYGGGTPNVQGIAGFGKAVEISTHYDVKELTDKLRVGIENNVSDVFFNSNGLPNILNVCFINADGRELVRKLSERGIYVSQGSCGNRGTSHVLMAIGLTKAQAESSIRFSFGKYNTLEEIDYILEILPELVNNLRAKRG